MVLRKDNIEIGNSSSVHKGEKTMKLWKLSVVSVAVLAVLAVIAITGKAMIPLVHADDDDTFNFSVQASVFDPSHTKLVSAEWEDGAGCPTGATEVKFNPLPPFNLLPPSSFTDPACPTGDSSDHSNQGLILVKSGETANNAAAGAEIFGVKGITLTDVGYDIRIGSHCGAGAPRFNITTTTGKFYFLGCNSPAPTTTFTGLGWKRLRWGTGTAGSVSAFRDGVTLEAITDPIKTMEIIFDEAQDTDPIGLAVLDNIDINGLLRGHGNDPHHQDKDDHKDKD
jgi:hypothetical protein